MTYETAAQFAQTWGTVYAVGIFGLVCVYAFWPRNKAQFDRAARIPLDEETDQ